MAKVIEFYIRGRVPKKVNPVPIEQRGKLVEFTKEEFAAQSKPEDTMERGDVRSRQTSWQSQHSLLLFPRTSERCSLRA